MTIADRPPVTQSSVQHDVASQPKATPAASATPRGSAVFAGLFAAAMATRPKAPMPMPLAAERRIPSHPTGPAQSGKLEQATRRQHREEDPDRDAKHRRAPVDPLDPTMRNPAIVASPVTPAAQPAAAEAVEAPRAKMSMEELLPALVRRIAWAGDKNKGTVRLELGAGAHAGTTLLVHADGGRVRVEVHGVEGRELDDFRRRLDSRLRGHGLDVESVT